MIIKNGSVFTNGTGFENVTVETTDDKIKSLHAKEETVNGADIYDAADCYVVPGFIDVHFHGCVGHDLCDNDLDGLRKMAEYELSNGVTNICPSTMTLSEEMLLGIVSSAQAYNDECKAGTAKGADLIGVNLEGPFICSAKKGAQNGKYIVPASKEMFYRLKEKAPELLKLITIAPETEGALEFIEEMHDEITISLGHTTANYETAKAAFDKGARHTTHLYNAMPPFAHRDAGVIGAAFDAKGNHVELICDGVHISDSVIRATFKLFSDDRVVLISDSMMATGMEDGDYSLGGQAVKVKGNLATLADGTIAGSATNLFKCFRHAIEVGIPLESAVKAATINPARAIRMDKEYGSIEAGKAANLLILDKDLNLKDIIFHGKVL